MYKLIMFCSVLIRQILLPNPFEALPNLPSVPIAGGVEFTIPAVVLNILVEPVLVPFTYGVVGLFYEPRSAPAWGSFLFLLFYCIHTVLLYFMCIACFAKWAIVLIVAGYIALLIGVALLRNRLTCRYL